jgi:Secretion system C-terminal sorting domain
VIETNDKGFAMVGDAFPIISPNQSNASDGWILKVDSVGCEVANCVLAIKEPEIIETEVVKIYPNPTSDWLKIELPAVEKSKDYHFKITNLLGQTLKSGDFMSKTTEIDVSDLSASVYLISIFRENELIEVKKVVVAR